MGSLHKEIATYLVEAAEDPQQNDQTVIKVRGRTTDSALTSSTPEPPGKDEGAPGSLAEASGHRRCRPIFHHHAGLCLHASPVSLT
jgi:hypothetical protein